MPTRGHNLYQSVTVLAVWCVSSTWPDAKCSFSPDTKSLQCSVQQLQAVKQSNLASAGSADSVHIVCSDDQAYQSVLQHNQFGHLHNLSGLVIERCASLEIEKKAFTGLEHLNTLKVSATNLWTTPAGIFCSLPSLTSLNLSTNNLQEVSDLGISPSSPNAPCLHTLKQLDLSFNKLSSLPARAFPHLYNLKQIWLEGNKISSLEDDALSSLASLQSINLAGNQLVALPPDLWQDTTHLQEIYLQDNHLSVLAPGIFRHLDSLLVLNLSRNDLSDDWINVDTFQGLVRLVALDLSHNHLSQLDGGVLQDLSSLQILDLQHNSLHTLPPHSFLSQNNLHTLILSHNQITQVHNQAFAGLSVLSSLSIDHNKIHQLHPDVLSACSSLQDIALNSNKLTSLSWLEGASLSLLRTLDVGENHLSVLADTSFDGLENLSGLRLAGNRISALTGSLLDRIPTVQVLNLANNQLSTLQQDTFVSLRKLQALRLDDNQLTDINGLLTAQNELRWLNVSANKLQWFDYAFIPKNLEWIDLHHNQIEELGNYYQLKDGFNLKTMDASFNKIKKLSPSSFLTSLENIYLNSNQIEEIPANTFLQMDNLSTVELVQNSLVTLQLAALALQPREQSDTVPEFHLGYNPFLCDCQMDYLSKINQLAQSGHYPHVMDLDMITCTINSHKNISAPHLMQPLLETSPSQFVCPYQAHCFALCQCCHFFACDCRMQCPDGCSCFHDSAWKHNVIQCSSRDHADVPPLIPMDATSIYLDGNHFGNFTSQTFIGRRKVNSLFLNSSKILSIGPKTFNGLSELKILHLEQNMISQIDGVEFENLTSLRELYLHDNRIFHIDQAAFDNLSTLQTLFLHNNLLSTFPVWKLSILPQLSMISVGNNSWTCDCGFVQQLQQFLTGLLVIDSSKLECVDYNVIGQEESRVNIGSNITCANSLAVSVSQSSAVHHPHSFVPLTVTILGVCLVLVTSSCLVFVFRTPLKVWLHSRYGIRLSGETNKSRDCLYDAFVSYSVRDEEFMQQIFLPHLDTCDTYYRLCLEHRDLPAGTSVIETWTAVYALCARVVMVVSRAFLDTEWEQVKMVLQDIRQDTTCGKKERKVKPVIVLLEELSSLDLAGVPEFSLLLQTSIVIRWNKPGFWDKLRFHLPDGRKHVPQLIPRQGDEIHRRPDRATFQAARLTKHGGVNFGPAGDWLYGSAGQTPTDSSTSTHSTMAGAGRPRSNVGDGGNMYSVMNSASHGGRRNPLEQWSDTSDCGYGIQNNQEHLYAQIPHARDSPGGDHLYHTLDPVHAQAGVGGMLEVMLPGGQVVSATLVRNTAGKIIPLVQTPNQISLTTTQVTGYDNHRTIECDCVIVWFCSSVWDSRWIK
eukprot:GFUD01045391.1.p1 GENE.GFUD01045391.1~~GFUD01045391.1.p1  ORF type:complete len:1363 (-),score=340.88 GFUD01045391.1:56-4144(-)